MKERKQEGGRRGREEEGNVIGNIHSGWKGTYQEIAKVAIQKLKNEYSTNPEDLICRYCTIY